MRIISKVAYVSSGASFRGAEQPLLSWYQTSKKLTGNDFSEVRESFRHADIYRDCVILTLAEKFRLITKIRYKKKRVYIRFVLTHPDYDKDL